MEKQKPEVIVGFIVNLRPGSETMPIFLARYPGYCEWSAFCHCKTMYAALPEHGGIPNYVKAHTAVAELLIEASQLGILANVLDEAKLLSYVADGEIKQESFVPPAILAMMPDS